MAEERLRREKETIRRMVEIFCEERHGMNSTFCGECAGLYDYAVCRLDKCPYGEDKPTCANCPIHCYKPEMRERVKQVMAFAGPRMALRYPLLSFKHWADGRKKAPAIKGRKT